MTHKKFQSIQALRGLAILLVLTRHLFVMEGHFGHGERLLPDLCKVGDGGVDLFFAISGFIMVMISHGQFAKPGFVGSFLYKRATRIYPLYWFYSLVILLAFVASPAWVPALKRGHVDLFASFLLLPQLILPLLGQGWTLSYEVYFYLMFALALLLPEKRLPRFLLLWGLGVAAGYNLYVKNGALAGNAWLKLLTDPVTIEFVLGACVAWVLQRGWRRGGWLCLIAGSLLLPASSLFFDPLQIEGLRFFCFGLPALLILYGAVSLEARIRIRFPNWLQAIGDASYSIYLSHILVITAVGRAWSLIGRPGLWDNAMAIAAMTGAALGCGMASYRFIEQPMLRALHAGSMRRKVEPFATDVGIVTK